MDSSCPQTSNSNADVEKVEHEATQQFKNNMRKLHNIWEDFGLESDQKSTRTKVVWDHVNSLLVEILNEESIFYEDIKQRIQRYTLKIIELSKVLSIPSKEFSGSLIKKEELLRLELDRLTKLKNKRIKIYQDLKNEELKLCQMLKLHERQLPYIKGVPYEKDLQELEQNIILLKDEKQRRHAKFCSMKKELTSILETVELPPKSVIQENILFEKEDFLLCNETFKALEDAICKAQAKKEQLESFRKNLVERLSNLWQRLKVEESKRIQFLLKHADCRLSSLKAIEQELERCEKLKKDNIKISVESLKEELNRLWIKCHVSENQKNMFKFYSVPEMSDEILDAFDAEVEKWKKCYEEVKHILIKVNKRQELFDLLIKFENQATDPNRFKNRRGNLLQEERQRKKLQRDLPSLEDQIFSDIKAYENEKGMPFLYYGEDYRVFITKQWASRTTQKENERLKRQKEHYIELQNEITVGTPVKRQLTTPKSAPSKLFKSSTFAPRTPQTTPSKLIPNTVAKLASRPSAIKLRDKIVLRERNQTRKSEVDNLSFNSTTYTQFAGELNKTARCSSRSSTLATKRQGGTSISLNNSRNKKRKSASKSLHKSPRQISKTTPMLTPARGKFGLPFLI